MKEPPQVDTWLNDDYAGLEVDGVTFYFGYEFDADKDGQSIYGFEVTKGENRLFGISHGEMLKYANCPDLDEMAPPLLFGIGLYLSSLVKKGE